MSLPFTFSHTYTRAFVYGLSLTLYAPLSTAQISDAHDEMCNNASCLPPIPEEVGIPPIEIDEENLVTAFQGMVDIACEEKKDISDTHVVQREKAIHYQNQVKFHLTIVKAQISLRKYKEAFYHLAEAGKKCKHVTKPCEKDELQSHIYKYMVEIYQRKGYVEAACQILLLHLPILQRIHTKPHVDTAICLRDLGKYYEDRENIHMALSYYAQAAKVFNYLGDCPAQKKCASMCQSIGMIYANQSQPYTALAYFQVALKRYRNKQVHGHNPHKNVINCLRNMGKIAIDIKKFDDAANHFREAWAILIATPLGKKTLSPRAQASILFGLGISLYKKEAHQEARTYFLQIEKEYPNVTLPKLQDYLIACLAKKADVHYAAKRYKHALSLYQQAIDRCKQQKTNDAIQYAFELLQKVQTIRKTLKKEKKAKKN